jgi:hypothetical protein
VDFGCRMVSFGDVSPDHPEVKVCNLTTSQPETRFMVLSIGLRTQVSIRRLRTHDYSLENPYHMLFYPSKSHITQPHLFSTTGCTVPNCHPALKPLHGMKRVPDRVLPVLHHYYAPCLYHWMVGPATRCLCDNRAVCAHGHHSDRCIL